MTSVGLIINGRSNRSASVIDDLVHIARQNGSVSTEVLDGVNGLGEALAGMNRKNVDTLILAGGDGTMQAALTDSINQQRFERLPKIVALPCGMTNVIANDCGLKGSPAKSLDNFLMRRQKGDVEIIRRSLMGVKAGSRDPVFGFFFGAGAFHSAVEFSRTSIQAKGARRSLALLISVAGYIFKVAFDPENTIDGVDIDFIDHGAEVKHADGLQTVFVATTLNKLGSGIFPFWGSGAGAMASTIVAYPPRRLLRAAPAVLRAKSKPWFGDYGYHSWHADQMALRFDGPYVFDGEIFHANRDEDLIFETSHNVEFMQ